MYRFGQRFHFWTEAKMAFWKFCENFPVRLVSVEYGHKLRRTGVGLLLKPGQVTLYLLSRHTCRYQDQRLKVT
jgi:hypothetical protein